MEIYIMCGLPASGKSSYVERRRTARDIVLRRDNIYKAYSVQMRKNYNDVLNTKDAYNFYSKIVEVSTHINASNGFEGDVYIDQTTLSIGSLKKLLETANIDRNAMITILYLDTPLEECLRRNAERQGDAHVPEEVIENMAKHFSLPEKWRKMQKDYPNLVLIDVNKL